MRTWRGIGAWLNFKHMSPQKAVSLVFVASILLLVVGYGIWQFGKLISPSNRFSSDPIVELKISNFSGGNFTPLPNSLTDTTLPNYTDVGTVILNYGSDGLLSNARMEGAIDYR